jgi:acyl carrier protein
VEATRDRIVEIVRRSVAEVNEELRDDVKLDGDAETVLYGRGAKIASMTLVSLIVAVEENLRGEFGLAVTLANEKAMSMERSPFKTLGSLIAYVIDVVAEARKPVA